MYPLPKISIIYDVMIDFHCHLSPTVLVFHWNLVTMSVTTARVIPISVLDHWLLYPDLDTGCLHSDDTECRNEYQLNSGGECNSSIGRRFTAQVSWQLGWSENSHFNNAKNLSYCILQIRFTCRLLGLPGDSSNVPGKPLRLLEWNAVFVRVGCTSWRPANIVKALKTTVTVLRIISVIIIAIKTVKNLLRQSLRDPPWGPNIT